MGAEYFLLRLRRAHSGGPLHEKIKESIRLFGEEVIPACGYGNAAAESGDLRTRFIELRWQGCRLPVTPVEVGMTNEVERVETDA